MARTLRHGIAAAMAMSLLRPIAAGAWEPYGFPAAEGWVATAVPKSPVTARVYVFCGPDRRGPLKKSWMMDRISGDLVFVGRVDAVEHFYFAATCGPESGEGVRSSESHVRASVVRRYIGPETGPSVDMTVLMTSVPGYVEYVDEDAPAAIAVGDTFLFACHRDDQAGLWVGHNGRLLRYEDGRLSRFLPGATFDGYDPLAYLEDISKLMNPDGQVGAAQLIVIGTVGPGESARRRVYPIAVEKVLKGTCDRDTIDVRSKDLGDDVGELLLMPESRLLMLLEADGDGYRPVANDLSLYLMDDPSRHGVPGPALARILEILGQD